MSRRAPALPVASLLLAATLWGLLWLPLRWLEGQGLGGLWTTLVSFSVAALTAPLWLRGEPPLRRWPWRRMTVLALAAGWCNTAFILAVLDGTVVRVLLLFYLSPVWAMVLARVLLREQITWSAWLNAGVALGGAAVMLYRPGVFAAGVASSDLLAVSAGLGFALSNVMVRGTPEIGAGGKAAANWVGVAGVAAIGLALSPGGGWPAVSAAGWAGAVLLGLGGFVVMTAAVAYGVGHLPVHRASVIMLFELVVGTLSSQLLTAEVMGWREWLGGGLIVIAAWRSARATHV